MYWPDVDYDLFEIAEIAVRISGDRLSFGGSTSRVVRKNGKARRSAGKATISPICKVRQGGF